MCRHAFSRLFDGYASDAAAEAARDEMLKHFIERRMDCATSEAEASRGGETCRVFYIHLKMCSATPERWPAPKEEPMTVKTDGLTNTEIVTGSKTLLTRLQAQVRYLMEHGMQAKPCPNCGAPHTLPAAAGIAVDEFDFGNTEHVQEKYRCSACNRRLVFVLPFLGGVWHWALDPAEAGPRAAPRSDADQGE